MTAVLDVCGAMEIILQKGKAEKFAAVLQEASLVIAPDLYIPELTNTLWKYNTAKVLTETDCIQYIQDGINYIDKFITSAELWQEAFAEAIHCKHPVYDMLFMITARRNRGVLITCDSVLASLCKKNNVQVCF
ncbi:MAG: type II toxin-antitoxin system VapC family toxin [Treponema sp.]|nr:type II toxin-antitoxin system VapC family toxin [Treponema sp.]